MKTPASNVRTERTRIDLAHKPDVVFWTKALKINRYQLAVLIGKFGDSAAVIRRELRR